MTEQELAFFKAGAWEEAKGHLRKVVMYEAFRGKCDWITTADQEKHATARWMETDKVVEAFISDFENEGRNE